MKVIKEYEKIACKRALISRYIQEQGVVERVARVEVYWMQQANNSIYIRLSRKRIIEPVFVKKHGKFYLRISFK